MGVKKRLEAYKILNSAVMTGTTTVTSTPTYIGNTDNLQIQIGWSGAAVGTITIELSPDNVLYDAITFPTPITQPNNNTGTRYSILLALIPATWIRVKYVNASSTGLLTATLTAKDLN